MTNEEHFDRIEEILADHAKKIERVEADHTKKIENLERESQYLKNLLEALEILGCDWVDRYQNELEEIKKRLPEVETLMKEAKHIIEREMKSLNFIGNLKKNWEEERRNNKRKE